MRYRCLSCDGEYGPDQPGGYYHVCPPERITPAGPVPIINPRDENLDDSDRDKPKRPRREGKGRVPAGD